MGTNSDGDGFRGKRIAAVDELVTLSESLSALSKVMTGVATGACVTEGPDAEEACLLAGTFLAHAAADLSRVADDVDRLRSA